MEDTQEFAIKAENISKIFVLPHEKNSSIKTAVVNFYRRKKGYEMQEALKNVSFEIKKGEFFGIVGRNGSGKSTLLKLLAGIYTPTKGNVQVNGSLTPFIELGVGFNPELTGRENVFLNGALLGFNRKEMRAMYEDIVEFAELEKFMDQKLKNYSSGMQVRLAFSIAIRAKGDILLLDEVLAVGDSAFQRKCFNYFATLKRSHKTVILVTHDMDLAQRFCARAMLIEAGKVLNIAKTPEITKGYIELNQEGYRADDAYNLRPHKKSQYAKAFIKTLLLNQDEKHVEAYNPTDLIVIRLEVNTNEELRDVVVGITLENSNGETIFSATTEPPNEQLPEILKKGQKLFFDFKIQNIFGEDIYTVDSAMVSKDRAETYYKEEGAAEFKVQNRGSRGWLIQPKYELNIKSPPKDNSE
jgi:ABC-2 type transport system ATP-binding protein